MPVEFGEEVGCSGAGRISNLKNLLMKTQMSNTGFMPRGVAITLLASNYSKTNSFRKRCLRATERVCEPVSRSTQLDISAPRTGEQRLNARLKKATAAQLNRWAKRTLARGNRYQDMLAEVEDRAPLEADQAQHEAHLGLLHQQISAHDRLGDAINLELTDRAGRGKGYRKPVKFKVEKV